MSITILEYNFDTYETFEYSYDAFSDSLCKLDVLFICNAAIGICLYVYMFVCVCMYAVIELFSRVIRLLKLPAYLCYDNVHS